MIKRALLPILILILAGCTVQAGAGGQEEIHMEFRVENARGDITRTFSRADTVRFVFELTNRGDRPRPVSYTYPPHKVSVIAEDGEIAWQAFRGRMFPQVMRTRELSPGETVTFAVEWRFERGDDPGQRVPEGEYQVRPDFSAFLDGGRLQADLRAVDITLLKTDSTTGFQHDGK